MQTFDLKHPVQFGSEMVSALELKPSAKAFRGFSQKVGADGGIVYEPYELALVGIKMAGKPEALLDMMHPGDMNALAQVVMPFLASGLETGTAP